MSLIDELIGGQWLEKTAKSLNHGSSISNLATSKHFESEFFELLNFLAIKYFWEEEDFHVWKEDLNREPKNTIDVLRALRQSWLDGRFGVL
jgi:hypothetical protein